MFRRVFRVKVELTSRCEGRKRARVLGKLKQGGKKGGDSAEIYGWEHDDDKAQSGEQENQEESLQSERDNEMKWLFKKASLIF